MRGQGICEGRRTEARWPGDRQRRQHPAQRCHRQPEVRGRRFGGSSQQAMSVEIGYDQFDRWVITCRQKPPELGEKVTARIDLIREIGGVQLRGRRRAVGAPQGTGGAAAPRAGRCVAARQDRIFCQRLVDCVIERARREGKQRRQLDDCGGDLQLGPEIEPNQRGRLPLRHPRDAISGAGGGIAASMDPAQAWPRALRSWAMGAWQRRRR